MSYRISSQFQQQESFRFKGHSGIDFAMENGTELKAIEDGTIRIADYGNVNTGKTVFIDTEDGRTLIYGHLSQFSSLKNGDHVGVGETIGYSGNSGHVVGSGGGYHLHFGIKEDGYYQNPSSYIERIQSMNTSHLAKIPINKEELIEKQPFTYEDIGDIQQSFFESLKSISFNFICLLFN